MRRGRRGEAMREQLQRSGGERAHVGDAVGAAGLDRDRALDRAGNRDTTVARRIAVAIAGGTGGADLSHAPGGRKALARAARQDLGQGSVTPRMPAKAESGMSSSVRRDSRV